MVQIFSLIFKLCLFHLQLTREQTLSAKLFLSQIEFLKAELWSRYINSRGKTHFHRSLHVFSLPPSIYEDYINRN